MSIYKKELLRAYDRANIQREQQARKQQDLTAAYDRLSGGGGLEGLSNGAVAMYNKVDRELKAQQAAEQLRVKKERAATPWLDRTWKSVADVGGRLIGGVMKFGENIVDNVATTFGADEEWVKKDHVYDVYGSKLDEYTKSSYLNDGAFGKIIQNTASGIGNMLPAIAINIVAPGAGMPLFMAGAAGGGMESALQNGASRGQAILYGNLAGVAEGAIEKLSGGIGGVGKGIIDNVFKNSAKSAVKSGVKGGLKNTARKVVGEGLEEVAMDLLDPVLAGTYKGSVDYSDVSLGSLANTFAVGGMTGAAMGGGQSLVRKMSPNADVSSALGEINEIASNLEKNFASGRLTEEQIEQGRQDVQYLRDKVSRRYDGLSERKQDKLVGTLGRDSSVLGKIEGAISANRNGSDSQSRAQAQYNRGIQRLASAGMQVADADVQEVTSNSAAEESGLNKNIVQEQSDSVDVDVAADRGNSRHRLVTADNNGVKYNQVAMSPSIALNNTRLEYAPTAKAITAEQQAVIKSHSKVSGGKTKIVFTDNMVDKANADGSVTSFNGAYKDGIIYIPTNSKEPAKVALMHEFNHALEGTAEHSAFTKYVAEQTSTRGSAAAKKYGAFEDVAGKVIRDYEVDNIDGDSVEGTVAAQKVSTETVSRYAEQMFSDDKSINRLARANKGKARRALGFITDKLVEVTAKKHPTTKDRELRQYLLRAEQLYRKAIQAAPNKPTKRMISTGDDDKRGAEVATNNGKEMQFDIKKDNKNRLYVEITDDSLKDIPQSEWKNVSNQNLKSKTAKAARNKEQLSAIDSESDSDIQYSQRRSGKNSAEYIQAAEEHSALNARIVEELLDAERVTKSKAKLKILTKSELRAKAKECFEDVVLDFLPKFITQSKQKYSLNKQLRLNEIFENILDNNAFYDLCRGSDRVINKLVNKVIENAVYTNAAGESITLTTCKGTRYRHVKYNLAHDLVKELSIDGVLDGRQTMQYAQAAAEGEARRAVRYYDKQLQQYYSKRYGIEKGKLVEQKLRLKKEQEKYYSKRQDFTEYEKGLRVQVKIIDFINKKIKKIDTGERRYHDGVLARDEMRDLIKAISSLPYAGKINNVDKVITALKGALSYIKSYKATLDEDSVAGFGQDTIDSIEYLIFKSEKSGMKSITNRNDMTALYRIIQAVEHQYRTHSAIVINGVVLPGIGIANKAYQEAQFAGTDAKFGGRMLDKAMQIATDPRTVIARAFGATSDSAEMIKLYTELTRCESLARSAAITLISDVESFMKKNKKYRTAIDHEMIKFGDIDITLGEAINIDMQRSQYGVDERLVVSGVFGIRDKRKRVESKSITKEVLDDLRRELAESKWSEENKEFVGLLEKGYLASNAIKIDADSAIQGYTMIRVDGKYVPIQVEKSVINNSWLSAKENVIDNFVSEYSINKHRVNNAMAQMRLTSAYDAFIGHSQQLANYRHMTLALRNMDIVLNQNVNVGMGARKATLGEYVFKSNSLSVKQYLVQLFQDIQGVDKSGDTALGKIRSSWVKSVLGANIKTVLNQFSGLPMASIYIKQKNLIKGVSSRFTGYKKDAFDAYSKYGVARTYDRSAARAKGISGKIGWFGNLTTAGIQIADNAMMHSIWNACVAQIESQVGHRLVFDTAKDKDNEQLVITDTADNSNWEKVAELFELTVRHTQSNDFASEKTGGQRHKNEVLRFMLGVFSGDASKMLSNMVRNISYYRNATRAGGVCERQIKSIKINIANTKDSIDNLTRDLAAIHKNNITDQSKIEKKLSTREHELKMYNERLAYAEDILNGLTADRSRSGKMFMKSIIALAESQVMFVLISLLFSLMREEKDKDGGELNYGIEFAKRLGDSVVGLFPLVRDIVPAITKGYKMEHYAYGMINDVIDNVVAVGSVVSKGINGQQVKPEESVKAVRGLLFSIGATVGVPLRNMERIFRTVTGNSYEYSAFIYGAKTKDINTAIASGKTKQAKEAYRVKFMRDYGGAMLSERALEIMFNFYSDSYKKTTQGDNSFKFNLPSGVPSKISARTSGGAVTDIIVKGGDVAIFKANFALATAEINALVLSHTFKKLSAKEQAKAIESVYARYYSDSNQAVVDRYNTRIKVSNTNSGKKINQNGFSGELMYMPTREQIMAKVMNTTDMATLLGVVSTIESDRLPGGKTQSNSKRAKVLRALNAYGLSYADKEIVLLALGYTPTNKAATRRAIKRTSFTELEKTYMLGKIL